MTKVIFKYPIRGETIGHNGEFYLDLPAGAQILTCATQNRQPCIWALVDPVQPDFRHRLRIIPTGSPIDAEDISAWRHIGTAHGIDGSLVFHAFEWLGARAAPLPLVPGTTRPAGEIEEDPEDPLDPDPATESC